MPTKYRVELRHDPGPCGFWIDGSWVKTGYVVLKDGCNPMPSALWFSSIPDALRAIRIFEYTGDTEQFWHQLRAERDQQERKPQSAPSSGFVGPKQVDPLAGRY